MATASFRFTVDQDRETGVRQALAVALRAARGCPGCVDCWIERDTEAHGGLRFHSRWDDESDLRAFLASDVTTRLLQLLELSLEQPEILICWGDLEIGLRSLEEIRGAIDSRFASAETDRCGCGCESTEDRSSSFAFRQ
jgi:quinol monooxygenase YgiN